MAMEATARAISFTTRPFIGIPKLRKELEPGTIVAKRYRIIDRCLQNTIMSSVYRAIDLRNNQREVVLKIVNAASVEKKDFAPSPMTQNIIWEALLEAGYINESGTIQPKFNGQREDFQIDIRNDDMTDDIFNVLNQACKKSSEAALEIEADILKEEIHPDYPKFYEAGKFDDQRYIAIEYISGITLAKLIHRDEKISLAQAIETVMLVAQSLIPLHKRGIIHRDIKPSNVMMSDRVRTIDFGIACPIGQRDDDERITGTPQRLAPEQAFRLALDERVDIYTLGLMLYETITGTNPQEAQREDESILEQVSREMPPLSRVEIEGRIAPDQRESLQEQIDRAHQLLQGIIDKTTAKDREQRFRNLEELLPQLEHARAIARELAPYESLI